MTETIGTFWPSPSYPDPGHWMSVGASDPWEPRGSDGNNRSSTNLMMALTGWVDPHPAGPDDAVLPRETRWRIPRDVLSC
ncbi:hypothetical protein RRG08_020378 [Elysia crispata]|uniref:Uncharacterized protein n=1 Tax=Elysia crispata TaxID=231223 RepID=A0AAE1DAV1_9GAST|nr:hypothetical protein RRG08_020378 [Elysia crispata]